MTGYGKASCTLVEKEVTIEIKSLNSKQLDLYFRLPNGYRDREMELRNEIACRLKRGKIEVILSAEYSEGKQTTQINTDAVKNYYSQLRSVAHDIGLSENEPLLQTILRLPDALNTDKEDIEPAEIQKILETLSLSLDEVEKYRITEGLALGKDISYRISLIVSCLDQIEPLEHERSQTLRNKLESSLLEFVPQESIDKNRYEQELIYYLEKQDIAEEKTRLRHHCDYFLEAMEEADQVGRKLGFIAQEIGREINTIGSKANHSGIQKLVVLMKDELEKIKEQLMNVL
jgi:uncharacterized protein (TIGR00255 family)